MINEDKESVLVQDLSKKLMNVVMDFHDEVSFSSDEDRYIILNASMVNLIVGVTLSFYKETVTEGFLLEIIDKFSLVCKEKIKEVKLKQL